MKGETTQIGMTAKRSSRSEGVTRLNRHHRRRALICPEYTVGTELGTESVESVGGGWDAAMALWAYMR